MRAVLPDLPYVQRHPPIDGAWQIVQAARLVPKKGLSTALRAFAAFGRQYPEAAFVIAGDGPMEGEVRELAAESWNRPASEICGLLRRATLQHLFLELAHFPCFQAETAGRGCRGAFPTRDARGDGERTCP